MARILAVANAHALAHVSRPLEVAKVLRCRGHEILFGGHGKYLEIAGREGFETIHLPYVSVETVVQAVRSQRLDMLYRQHEIAAYVEAELQAYRSVNPDLLIVDNRPTAITSAEYARIRTVSIVNVHMSHAKEIPFHSLRNVWRMGGSFPFKYIDRVESLIEGYFVDRFVMGDLGRLRRRLGLRRRHGFANEEGDLNLYPDLPEFNPVSKLPLNARYVGPLTWHNDMPAPEFMKGLAAGDRCTYFTVGSEGLEELLANVVTLSSGGRPIIIATGEMKRAIDFPLPDNVYVEKFVNTDKVLPYCGLVVCHGGNGTIYQALSHGVPIVGIATHEEQYYGLKRVNELGLGIGMRARTIRQKGLQPLIHAINEVAQRETYRSNAQRFQGLIAENGNSAEKAADFVERFILSGRPDV